jgi:hypothetical protein
VLAQRAITGGQLPDLGSEARYLARTADAHTIRDRIAAQSKHEIAVRVAEFLLRSGNSKVDAAR